MSSYTKEVHDALLAAFREEPGNVSRAARVAGCSRPTADKAWKHGFRNKVWARVPLKDVLEEEQESARRARIAQEIEAQRQEDERRIQQRIDAMKARDEEAQGAKASRTNAIGLALVVNRMLVAAQKAAEEIQSRVNQNLATIALKELRGLVADTARAIRHAESVMLLALQIERLVQGEPLAVVGVRVDQMSPDQMLRQLEHIQRTITRAGRHKDAVDAHYEDVAVKAVQLGAASGDAE